MLHRWKIHWTDIQFFVFLNFPVPRTMMEEYVRWNLEIGISLLGGEIFILIQMAAHIRRHRSLLVRLGGRLVAYFRHIGSRRGRT